MVRLKENNTIQLHNLCMLQCILGVMYYGGTQHALQHEAFHLKVTTDEIHTLIVDVCV